MLLVYERARAGAQNQSRLAAYSVEMGLNPEQLPWCCVTKVERILFSIVSSAGWILPANQAMAVNRATPYHGRHTGAVIALLTALGLCSPGFEYFICASSSCSAWPDSNPNHPLSARPPFACFCARISRCLGHDDQFARAGHALNKSIQMVGLEGAGSHRRGIPQNL
jgi:hypothetical protein